MYRVNYQFDKHKITILMICSKEGDSWKQLNDSDLENQISAKIKNVSETYRTDKGGFGEMHLTDRLTYITGKIDLNK